MSSQQDNRLQKHKEELDERDKKIQEKEKKLRDRELELTKAHQKVKREREEVARKKRHLAKQQPASIHFMGKANKAKEIEHHLTKAENDLKKTKHLLDKKKKQCDKQTNALRKLKPANDDKDATIKRLTTEIKNKDKGKKHVHNDQKNIKHLKAQITNLKNKLKISEQIKYPRSNKENSEIAKAQEIETKYNDLQYEVEALQQQLQDVIDSEAPPMGGKQMKKKMLSKLQKERDYINNEIKHNNKLRRKPLHRFTYKDVANKIKQWVLNDINYNKNIKKAMEVLAEKKLWGKTIIYARIMVQNDFLTFMTYDTFSIIFEELNEHVKSNRNNIKSQTAAEIGYLIYEFPLIKLLHEIKKDKIDGEKFIRYYEEENEWIAGITGWNKTDVYQIESILFQHQTFSIKEIKAKFDKVDKNKVYDLLVKKYVEHEEEFEELHYQIKTGQSIENFSDFIMNMIDDLTQNENNTVRELYQSIAECFTSDNIYVPDEKTLLYNLQKQYDWTCSCCGNYNFCNYMSKKKQYNLSECILCGVTQTESVILQLKKHDTFIMIKNERNDTTEEQDDVKSNVNNSQSKPVINHIDDIDKLIQEIQQKNVQKSKSFDISCPDRNDKEACTAILRLTKYLIRYNRWIKKVYSDGDDTDKNTVDVNNIDISKHITDDVYITTVKNCFKQLLGTKCDANGLKLFEKILSDEKEGIANLSTFLSLNRKEFSVLIKKYTKNKIKPTVSTKLFKSTKNALKNKAHAEAFGQFLSELDSQQIDADYHHILHSHINLGTDRQKEQVFVFFEHTVHYEDTESEKKEGCQSFKRRQRRADCLDDNKANEISENAPIYNNIDIWSLKQHYMQSTLDVIHSYLVHPDWQRLIKRKKQKQVQNDNDEKTDDEKELTTKKEIESIATQKKSTYITKITNDDEMKDVINYRFGVDHSHPDLNPKCNCLKNEILYNPLYKIKRKIFHELLIKAIRIHEIAVNEYKYQCKYYKWEYNIIRNTPIGIRHILALTIYTDISQFCTKFRETYRRINGDTDDYDVTQRHTELYYYARSLFEAVEFYGFEMSTTMKVHHGLNRKMNFSEFTTFFNQPISTTTSVNTAKNFATDSGIILTLKSGSAYFNTAKIPKYLGVSFISDFPDEAEKLFYGANSVFKIFNIMEGMNNEPHKKELKIFNNFQKAIKNEPVEWKKSGQMVDSLVELIKYQQEPSKKLNGNQKGKLSISKYGQELFNYFCNNKNTTSVCVNDYKSLPLGLRNALFINLTNNKKNEGNMSLIPLSKLFKYLNKIILSDLDIDEFKQEAPKYVAAVEQYVKHSQNAKNNNLLQKIFFQSKSERNRKPLSTLKQLTKNKMCMFKKSDWNIEYELDHNMTHNLKFTKSNENNQAELMTPIMNENTKEDIDNELKLDSDMSSSNLPSPSNAENTKKISYPFEDEKNEFDDITQKYEAKCDEYIRLKEQNNKCMEQVKNCNGEIEILTKERNEFEMMNGDIKNKLQKETNNSKELNDMLEEYKIKMKQIKEELEKEKKEKDNYRTKCEEQMEENKRLVNEKESKQLLTVKLNESEMVSDGNEYKNKIEILNNENEEWKNKYNELNKNKHDFEKKLNAEIEELKGKLKECNGKFNRQMKKNNEIIVTVDEYKMKNKQLIEEKNQIFEMNKKNEITKNQYNEKIGEITDRLNGVVEEKNELNGKVNVLNENEKMIKNELEKEKKENDKYKTKCEEQMEENKRLVNEKSKLNEMLEEYKKKCDDLKQEESMHKNDENIQNMINYNQKIELLTKENNEKKNENQRLLNNILKLESEKTDIENEYKEQIDTLNDEKNEIANKLEDEMKQNKELLNKYNKLIEDEKSLKNTLDIQVKKNEELLNKYNNKNDEYNTKIKQFENEFKTANELLLNDKNKFKNMNNELLNKISDMQKQNHSLMEEKSKITNKLEVNKYEMNELMDKYNEIKEKMVSDSNEYNNKIDVLKNENGEWGNKYNELNKNKNQLDGKLNGEIEELKGKLNECDIKMNQQMKGYNEIKGIVDEYNMKNKQLIEEKNGILEMSKKTNDEYKQQIDTLNGEKNEITNKLEDEMKQNKELLNKYNKLIEDEKSLKNTLNVQVKKNEELLNQYNSENNEYNTKVKQFENELDNNKNECDKIKKEFEQSKKLNDEYKQKINLLNEEKNEMRNRLKISKNEMNELRETLKTKENEFKTANELLLNDKNKFENTNNELLNNINEMQKQNYLLKEENDKYKNEENSKLKLLNKNLTTVRESNSNLTQANTQLNETIVNLKNKIVKNAQQINEQSIKYDLLQSRLDEQLNTNLKEKQESMDKYGTKIPQLQKAIQHLQNTIISQNKKHMKDNDKFENTNNELLNKISEIQKQNYLLNEENDKYKNDEFGNQVPQLRKAIAYLQKTISENKQDYDKIKQKCDKYINKCDKYKKNKTEFKRKTNELLLANKMLKKTNEGLEKQIANINHEKYQIL